MRIDGKASIDGVRNILGMLMVISPTRSSLWQLTTCISYDARDRERDKQDEASVVALICPLITSPKSV
jgi:hypothetical protein